MTQTKPTDPSARQCEFLTPKGQRCQKPGAHYLCDDLTPLCQQHWKHLLQKDIPQCDCLTPDGQRCPKPGAHLMRDSLTLLCQQHWECHALYGIQPTLRPLPWR